MQINLSAESVNIVIEALEDEIESLNKTLKLVSGVRSFEDATKKKIKDVEDTLDTFRQLKEEYGC